MKLTPGLLTSVLDDFRSNPLYLPPCPLCSFLTPGQEPIIRGPTLMPNRVNKTVRLMKCCALSDAGRFVTADDAVEFWLEARKTRRVDPSLAARRERTLARLREAHYEPI